MNIGNYRTPALRDVDQWFSAVNGKASMREAIGAVFEENKRPWVANFDERIDQILDRSCDFFSTHRENIRVVGSAFFGFSPLTLRPFCPGISDLDIAVIDSEAFDNVLRHCKLEDVSKAALDEYAENRIIRPDKLQNVEFASNWIRFFKNLASEFQGTYANISATLYGSKCAFISQQREAFESFSCLYKYRELTKTHKFSPGVCPEDHHLDAEELLNYARFPADIKKCFPENSSPHSIELSELSKKFVPGGRRRIQMERLLSALSAKPSDVTVQYLLIGGSFLNPNSQYPKDLDCAIYYSIKKNSGDAGLNRAPALLNAFYRLLLEAGIDPRMIPMDSDPALIIRLTAFVSSLFCASRGGCPSNIGALLVHV